MQVPLALVQAFSVTLSLMPQLDKNMVSQAVVALMPQLDKNMVSQAVVALIPQLDKNMVSQAVVALNFSLSASGPDVTHCLFGPGGARNSPGHGAQGKSLR